MSDPPLSDIDFKIKMEWVSIILKTTLGCDHLWIKFLLAQKSSKEVLSRELKWIQNTLLYFEQSLTSKFHLT